MKRLRASCLILCCFIVVYLLAGCGQDPTRPDHPQLVAGVAIQDVRFHSNALDRQMIYRVFAPTNLVAGQKLATVYLLHGAGANYRDWSNRSNVAEYARRGAILVMPQGDFSYYMNAVDFPRDKYEDYITKDLLADVESRFPAKHDRNSRAIVGISMGGFAAVDYALVHPDLYVFAGALSPSIDMPRRGFNIKRFGQWWRMRTIFGPFGSEERAARDPFELVRTVNPKQTAYLYLTVGEQEPLLDPNRRFEARLTRYGVAHEFHTKPGWHAWDQWNAQIPGCFESLLSHVSIQ